MTEIFALTAAGGNSRAARSARVRTQWRDRYGRWIEMGRGVKFKVRGADGAPRSVIGSFVGAKDTQTGQVYVHNDPNGLPDGFYDVSSANAQEFVANLSESQLAERGIQVGRDVNGAAVGERASEDIPSINEITRADAPEGWEKVPGTFAGKNVIQTDDGDFRIHFGGKDESTLLEDHRANPGVAEPQRSVAEAFAKVGEVDIQREESGDQAYTGLGSEEENAAALANRDRDAKVEQIKGNERTLNNERAPLGAKQSAMTANQQLMKELEDSGQPYDPEGNDSDEALAARKTAPEGAPAAPNAATPEADSAPVSAGNIDLSTFDVAPEGFLVPTGKQTNDISPEGLANFMTAEKEHLSKGGARLVVDTDSGTAEIHNSADTVDDAKAQAGGLGQDTVIDLATGQPVQVSEGAVDPNSPDVNPNLDGDTSQEAPSAENRNSDAVEPGAANTGADAPARPESNGEAEPGIPAATGSRASDSPDAPAGAGTDGDGAEGGSDGADRAESDAREVSSTAPGSVEELEQRRSKTKAALETAGDPEDIVALNEQMDALDTRIAAERANAPETDAPETPEAESDAPETDAPDNEARLTELAAEIKSLEEQNDRLQKDLDAGTSDRSDEEISAEIDEVFNKVADLQAQFDELEKGSTDEATEPEMSLADKLDSAWAATDPYPESNLERRERAALRILRDGEKKGDLEKAKARLSQEEQDALSDEIAEAVGIERAKPEPEAPEAPETPENAPEDSEDVDEEATPTEPPAELDEARVPADAPRPQTWEPKDNTVPAAQPRVEEPGDADAVAAARNELNAIDAEIENELTLAENSADPQEQATHLSRVRTLERQRKIQENALNRALGNAPMDFNRDLGWSLRNRDNRGELPAAPEAAPEVEDAPEADTPAVLDDSIEAEAPERPDPTRPQTDLKNLPPQSLNEGDFIEHPETGNIVQITDIEYERYPEEQATRFDFGYRSKNAEEEAENDAAGGIQIWSTDSVDTYKGWGSQPEPSGPPLDRDEAQRRYDEATADYFETLMKDDYTEAEYEAAEERRENARADLMEFDLAELQQVEPETQRLLDELDADPERERIDARAEAMEREAREQQELEAERERLEGVIDRNGQSAPRTDGRIGQRIYGPDEAADNVRRAEDRIAEINRELGDREAVEERVSTADGLGGLYDGGDDPYDVESGHDNKVAAISAKMQGKELSEQERTELESALGSGMLSDKQVELIAAEVDAKPNRSDTTTIARPETEQPEYLSTADVDIVNAERDDPSFVFDEDLTWRRIREEFPDATELENGDLILDTATNKGKKYDTMIRRTKKNRFMVYVMETDQQGNRRAKRIGNTEWHSYEALEKRITQGRKLIHSSSPAGSLARRKDQPTENLGTQGFPNDDFIGDIGNPDAALPTTGDEKFDRLLAIAAEHIRNRDADLNGIEEALQREDPGANAINTIMQAIIGRAQDNYRPDGTNPWQLYGGETAVPGMHVDWTDWHQELDWWLPNGQKNENRKPNPNYGNVRRGVVMGYVKENSDGKGHTYGDHVWVQFLKADGTPDGNWVKRSAQTLRMSEEGADLGLPFFSKREEWRSDPELLARRFRVPEVKPEEPVQTKPRPRGELPSSRRLRFTSRGTLAGYSNVPVPTSQAEIAGMLISGEVTPQIRPAREARPGMLIFRRDTDGNQHVDSIIRVENLGDGGYRIHAARPDGRGNADVDSFVVPGDADIALASSPDLRAPQSDTPEPSNARQGELVAYNGAETSGVGVVVHDDGEGNLILNTPDGTIDILESNIDPVQEPDVTTDQRQDLIAAMNDHDIPQYIQDLIAQAVLSPGLSAQRYAELVDVTNAFATKTATSRIIDWILDILGATDQQRSDVRAFFKN